MGKNNWTREQHILAFNLYNKLPFGKMHKANPDIKALAPIIDRSPGSIAMKLGNFARLDPALKQRGISGLTNGAKGEVEVWNEFIKAPEDLAYESEKLLAGRTHQSIESGDVPVIVKTWVVG